MAERKTVALIGTETLLGREIRDLAVDDRSLELKLVAAEEDEEGKLTRQSGEPALVWGLDRVAVEEADAVVLAGTPESTRRTVQLAAAAPDPPALVDLTHATEDHPRARLRAPMVEPRGYEPPPDAVHVVAHPAAIALALLLERLHAAFPLRRALAQVFEPASERGAAALDELQQQTVALLSFKGLPTKIFDAQASFNLLARYGGDAPVPLESIESRIERHLASLLALRAAAPPMPSLRLIQAPVFHGYSVSVWVEFVENPGVAAVEKALAAAGIDVRGPELDPPNNVGVAGQSGVAVGAVSPDRNVAQACWLWMAADNLRLAAENALAVIRELP